MKVIIAIDQTDNWRQIIDSVCKKCWPRDTSFRVLSVVEAAQWQDVEFAQTNELLMHIMELRQKHAEEALLQARNELVRRIPNCSAHIELRNGRPRGEILDSAVDWMADKIILGTHGNSPNRLVSAVISRAVAQYAKCSVELVRLKDEVHSEKKLESKEHTAIQAISR